MLVQSPIDDTSELLPELMDRTVALSSSLFGFPDFPSLLTFNANGTVRFWGGMIAKELGKWEVVGGNPDIGEEPTDFYVQFIQPLTERYMLLFSVPGGTCYWRAKLTLTPEKDIKLEGGLVISERDGTKRIREGIFTGVTTDEESAASIRAKSKEAMERALTTPKGESTGFKTPARIAGAQKKRRLLPKGEKEDVDLIEDDNVKRRTEAED